DHVLLGHAKVEEAVRMPFGEVDRAAGARQVCGQNDNTFVIVGQIGQFLSGDERGDRASADSLLGGGPTEDTGDLLRAAARRRGGRVARHAGVLAGRKPASISAITSS